MTNERDQPLQKLMTVTFIVSGQKSVQVVSLEEKTSRLMNQEKHEEDSPSKKEVHEAHQ